MPAAKTQLIRCLLFLLFSVANSLSLIRAIRQEETTSAYLSAATLALTSLGFLYFLVAYLKQKRQRP